MADEKQSNSEKHNKVGIYYQRSRHYRTIHADGAQFGVTPRGGVQFTLFTDQKPMPEFTLHQITPEGNLGGVLEQVVKEGFIREVEVNVVMDPAVAAQFIALLEDVLTQIKVLQEQAAKQAEQNPLGSQLANGDKTHDN